MNKKKLLIAATLLTLSQVNAQEAVATTGGDASGTNGNVSYTVGQVVYTTNTGTNGSMAQGVQQPYEIQTVLGLDNFNINLQMGVYPNPTSNWLVLEIKNSVIENVNYQLFDLNGRLILNEKINSETTTINLEQFPSAVYLLKVLENNKEVKTFKIIKK
ncbi:T9SS type A sorting domain-containing protein [Flavobacterium sp.]|uniref:T9SS type A sorting domain-containing protein n=1 Tax=Flavobacterium sp. TaxID=239 RepID=UPI003264736E